MADSNNIIGKPMDRVDGRLKVTGGARYSAEFQLAGLAHAVILESTIPSGQITAMDTSAASAVPGVLLVMTPFNTPKLPAEPPGANGARPQDRRLSLLQNNIVYYNAQPIAVVVADTFEHAEYAKSLIGVSYDIQNGLLEIDKAMATEFTPKSVGGGPPDTLRGDPDTAFKNASARVSHLYTTPMENHNPMEPHATTAVWDGDNLTVYDSSQGIFGTRTVLTTVFQIPSDNIRVVTYFVGGGFGCKGSTWSHVVLAAMAAQQTGRPIRLALARTQMFGPVGYRPQTRQQVALGAGSDGKLASVRHDTLNQTSTFDDFIEPSAIATRMLYASDTAATSHRAVRLNYGTPTFMRAPGESSGTFAIESAMDELSYAVNLDPVKLRLANYAEVDPGSGKPFSSKSLRECYRVGAERFGWDARKPQPRSMTAPDGRLLGMGMATATYPTRRSPATALATLYPEGTAIVEAGSQDIGTGTYTVMTQVAASTLGLPAESVRFELGDTRYPENPGSGGSQTAASTGSAVFEACGALVQKAIALAVADTASPLHGRDPTQIAPRDGGIYAGDTGETYAALLVRQNLPNLSAETQAKQGPEKNEYSMHSFGGVFVEALVDPDTGEIRLSRIVGAYGVGNRLNAKTARSQLIGGIVFGIGMALFEESVPDTRYGRIVNHDLAEYHVPVHADVPDIDIIFVDEKDPYINPLGIKGIGEIGITGVTAAIANAVYHATGKRVRDLPVTLDKVI